MLEDIKTISTVVFALIASTLAVLTYRRAKETFLQPVRSEVIKKQTELLIELYTLLGNEHSILEKIDYYNIVKINIFNSFKICGALFNNEESVSKMIAEEKGGGIMFTENDGRLRSIEKPELFSNDNKKKYSDDKKQDYINAKNNKYKISVLLFTKKYNEFQREIFEISNNPFLPIEIKKPLDSLMDKVRLNLIDHIRSAVEQSVNLYFNKGKKTLPDIGAVFNIFNQNRLAHREAVEKINLEIRKYLKIDSMPS